MRQAATGEEVLVLVMAGGEGRRIGGGKPHRSLGGVTLIERAWRQGRCWSADPLVSVRSPTQLGGLSFPVLPDVQEIEGPLAGLAAGLHQTRRIGRRFLLTIPCDMPFLPSNLPERLRAGIGPRAAAVVSSGGRPHAVCALWRSDTVQELDAYLATGRRSLIGFAQAVGYAAIDWPDAALFNINTQAELAEAERRLASEIQHLDQGPGREGGRSGP